MLVPFFSVSFVIHVALKYPKTALGFILIACILFQLHQIYY
jgi:hypothetical protein